MHADGAVGPSVGCAVGPAVGEGVRPLDEYEAMKPFAFIELSALRTTYIMVAVPVIAAGIPDPESELSSGALALLPSYTFTKS